MILVAGATGSLGNKIVHGLLRGGETVRVLARPSSNYLPLRSAGAEVAVGDLKDLDSLTRACHQVEVVISTASSSRRGDDTIDNVDLRGNQNLINAAEQCGVRHFIFVSTLGASADSPVPVFRAKAAVEQRLRESRMTHTILQPNAFMDVWFAMLIEMPLLSGNPVTLVGAAQRRHSFVAEQDVAAFAIAAAIHPAAHNATITIGGPEALSFREVVQAYEAAAGRSIQTKTVAPGQPIPGLPELVSGMAASLESFDSPVPMEDTARRFGVSLTAVRDFARSRLALVAQQG